MNVIVPFSLVIGLVTILVGGICAVIEADLKKLVAYSTLSQLGLIITGVGINPASSMFVHLITHAFFKSILFVCVGLLILSSLHNQVANKIGQVSPSVAVASTVSIISISGISFSAGFYSKHGLRTVLLSSDHSYLIILLFCIGVCLTRVYSGRLMLYLLKQAPRRTKTSTELVILSFFLIGRVLLGKVFTGDIGFSLFSPVISFLFTAILLVLYFSYCNQQIISSIFFSVINKKLTRVSYPIVDRWEKAGLIAAPLAAETLVSKPMVIVLAIMLLIGLL